MSEAQRTATFIRNRVEMSAATLRLTIYDAIDTCLKEVRSEQRV